MNKLKVLKRTEIQCGDQVKKMVPADFMDAGLPQAVN